MAWLDDHPPARSQFRRPRRETPSGVVVVHTAENTPDWVAVDGGAEAVANFIRGRSDVGSYHDLADSDTAINLVAYDCEAYHDGTGSNRHSYGVSVATRADTWPLAPTGWRDGAVRQAAAAAARYARWLHERRGFWIPARRISRAQSEARMPGFLSHAERDPARRTDPGAGFPWDLFLQTYAWLTGQGPKEDDVMNEAQERKLDALTAKVARIDAAVFGGKPNEIARQVWALPISGFATATGSAADLIRRLIREAGVDVDEAEMAAALAPVLSAALVDALPDAITDQLTAEQVDQIAETAMRRVLADAGSPG